MKKHILVFCLLVLISLCSVASAAWGNTSASATPVPGDYSSPNFTVSVTSKRVYNNHVGNKWAKAFTVGGLEIKKSAKVYVDPECGIAIQSEFEEDDKSPDYGWQYQVYIPNKDEMTKGFKVVQTVYVYEDRGRYSGNDACWEATFKFTPIKGKKK